MKTLDQMIEQETAYVKMKTHEFELLEKSKIKISPISIQMLEDHKLVLGWLKELKDSYDKCDSCIYKPTETEDD